MTIYLFVCKWTKVPFNVNHRFIIAFNFCARFRTQTSSFHSRVIIRDPGCNELYATPGLSGGIHGFLYFFVHDKSEKERKTFSNLHRSRHFHQINFFMFYISQGSGRGGKYGAPPQPPFMEEHEEYEEEDEVDENRFVTRDTCYHLLKLYCKRSHRLERLLSPSTSTAHQLDFSLR